MEGEEDGDVDEDEYADEDQEDDDDDDDGDEEEEWCLSAVVKPFGLVGLMRQRVSSQNRLQVVPPNSCTVFDILWPRRVSDPRGWAQKLPVEVEHMLSLSRPRDQNNRNSEVPGRSFGRTPYLLASKQ